MRIVTNEAHIQRNRKITNIMTLTSLGALGLGFFYSFTAPAAMSSVFCLALPFLMLLTLTSTRMTNNWVREPRPEKVLNEALKGLGQKYTLFHYVLPAQHVLVGPEGVLVLYTAWQNRAYRVKGSKWSGEKGLFTRLGGWLRQDLLGNPFYTAQFNAEKVQKILKKIAPDSGIEVQPVIVFIHPQGNFEAEDPAFPVVYSDSKKKPSLKNYLRELRMEKHATLSLEQLDEIDKLYGLVTRQELAAEGYVEPEIEDEADDISDDAVVARGKTEPGTFYLFQSGQLYAIGMTRFSLDERQEELQAQMSQPVELVFDLDVDDPEGMVTRYQKKFDRKRQKGEWFGLSKKDVSSITGYRGPQEAAAAETESEEA
ncbi:MAG TPA: GIY-YIG nuclease family protein [Aggregatilineaceae bacterium]|nr:GIY-YIG nuclease family protein [Aggregatilineaceae bacterium]